MLRWYRFASIAEKRSSGFENDFGEFTAGLLAYLPRQDVFQFDGRVSLSWR